MSCNALGSIFSKLCDSSSCVFGTLCNCCTQSHVVVIGDRNDPIIKDIISISQNHNDLNQALQALRALEGDNSSISSLAKTRSITRAKKTDDKLPEVRAAILQIVGKALKKIGHEKMSPEECMMRFTTAASFVGIKDIRDVYNQFTPIDEVTLRKLESQVARMQKYGSLAAFLWKSLKEEKCKNEKALDILVKNKVILPKQAAILAKIFKIGKRASFFNKNSFSEVERSIQSIFLKAAESSPEKFIRKQGFISWCSIELTPPPSSEGFSESAESESSQQQEIKQIMRRLSTHGEDESDSESGSLLGVRRTELLCRVHGFKETSLHRLTELQAPVLNESIERLEELDGTIAHLFFSLKTSQETNYLVYRRDIPTYIAQEIEKEIDKSPEFIREIKEKENLIDLSVSSLWILYEIANRISSKTLIDKWSSKYSLQSWRDKASLKLPPSVLVNHQEASSSGETLLDEKQQTLKIMDEKREALEKFQRNTQSRNSPERGAGK